MAYPFASGDVLTAADLNAAVVIVQQVQAVHSTNVDNATSTYADSGLTATITPQRSSNKILVMVTQGFGKNNGNTENRVQWRIMADATQIWISGSLQFYTGTAIFNIGVGAANIIHAPASTSAITYKTQFMNPHNTAQVSAQYGGFESTITLLEISA